jgi:hypothetical protein
MATVHDLVRSKKLNATTLHTLRKFTERATSAPRFDETATELVDAALSKAEGALPSCYAVSVLDANSGGPGGLGPTVP